MDGVTAVFAARASAAEVARLLFDHENEVEDDSYNTGIGKLFGVDFIEEDYFLSLESPKPTTPEKVLALPQADFSNYEIGKSALITLCQKHRINELTHFLLFGDTIVERAKPGQKKKIGNASGLVYYLGMFHRGRPFGESAADRKLLAEGWMPE